MGARGVRDPMGGLSRRLLPALALVVGLFLFGVSLFALGIEAAGEEPRPMDPSSLTVAGGTGILAYPTNYVGARSQRIEVSYAFPQGPGDAYVLSCDDLSAIQRGETPRAPLMSFRQLREGSFVVSAQTLSFAEPPCPPTIVFAWDAAEGDAAAGRPSATVTSHVVSFDMGRQWILLMMMGAGSVLVILGGLGARARSLNAPAPGSGTSPLEVLRGSLDRMGEQLERTRRHLLFAGVLGVFLWYPFLVPWAWKRAAQTGGDPLFPWAVGGLTLAFLVVLTALWARELHRLDRELHAWRDRMGELRARETGLMDDLERGG